MPQADIDGLHARLDDAVWPEVPDAATWSLGVPPGYLRELAEHWWHRFDWRAAERRIAADSVVVDTDDHAGVHVLTRRSSRPDAVPVLLLHGWPSTSADFLDMLGPLTEPTPSEMASHVPPVDLPAFHVVAPSLPGFGFSGPTRELGWDVVRHARCAAEVMAALGYERYLVQGGDFGSLIGPEIGRLHPERVLGVHVNALAGSYPDPADPDPLAGLDDADRARVADLGTIWAQRHGYAAIQSTRPSTLGYAMTDSPLGLLAWHLEWFVDYDPAGTAQTPVDPDAYLTDVTSFWLTRTAGSAMRLYAEAAAAFGEARSPSGVPTAVLNLPGDHAVRPFAERSHRIVRWTEHDRGGHFASLQAPDLLIDDLQAFTAGVLAGEYGAGPSGFEPAERS
ncbi:epoxide hydrolase family protein [Pseudonocardia phyllosphaerae]|uniref:epoxide hydrolase family protein n=1 Tax=Pseudonocardia phyllosphaerae TaxID=3390502 RepID=UPI00397A50EE